MKITDVQDLGDVMIHQLSELFTEKDKKKIKLILRISVIRNVNNSRQQHSKGINMAMATINFTNKSPKARVIQGTLVP